MLFPEVRYILPSILKMHKYLHVGKLGDYVRLKYEHIVWNLHEEGEPLYQLSGKRPASYYFSIPPGGDRGGQRPVRLW